MKKNLQNLLIFLLVFAVRIKAQNIQVMLSPNPSPFISDWQQKTETIKLVITNSTQQVIVAKIKTELLDGSGSIIASTDASKMQEIEIGLGVTTFDASEVFPMQAIKYSGKGEKIAMQTGKIPEDNYQLCVSLTSPQTGQTIGTSSKQCKAFNIVAYQAPVLISPSNLKVLNENEAKGLMFRWTPICCKLPDPPPTYQLQIWEVLEGQTPIVAIRSNQPIVEKTLNNLTQTQWPVEFAQPEAGKQYVWTVTTKDEEDRNLVDGNGFAEPFTFTINNNEKLVLDLLSPENGSKISGEDAKNIQFRWTPICCRTPPSLAYKLRVWELKNGQTAEQAVKNNNPLHEEAGIKKVEFLLKSSIFCNPPKLPCPNQIVWQVEATDESGNSLVKSELRQLTLGNEEKLVINLISPENGSKISGEDAKNIQFRWTPICCKTPPSHTYKLRVWELKNGQTAEQAVKNNKPILTNEGIRNTELSKINLWNEIQAYYKVDTPLRPVGTGSGGLPYRLIWIIEGIDEKGNVLAISEPNTINFVSNTCSVINNVWLKTSSGYQPYTFDFINCIVNTLKYSDYTNLCNQDLFVGSALDKCSDGSVATMIYTLSDNSSSYSITNTYSLTIPASLPNGNYTLTMELKCNGAICRTCSSTIIKDCPYPNPTNCCKGGKWIPPFLPAPTPTQENPLTYVVANSENGTICGKDLQNVKCNSYINFRYAYQCAAGVPNCNATITYVFKNGKTNEILNTFSNIANSRNLAFLTPNVSGYYCMTAYAKCSDKICDSCTVCFTIECPPPSKNCCPGKWIIQPNIYNSSGKLVDKITCPKNTFSFIIKDPNCKETFTIKDGIYDCDKKECKGKLIYNLIEQSSNSVVASGINSISISPSLTNGFYTLQILAICGTDTCETCKFNIRKDCNPIKEDCCKGGKWVKEPEVVNATGVSIFNVKCGNSQQGLTIAGPVCKQILTIKNGVYTCASKNCLSSISYLIIEKSTGAQKAAGISILTIPSSLTNGVYTVQIFAICGKDTCARCSFDFRKDCPPPLDCCKNSTQKEPIIYNADGTKAFDLKCAQPTVFRINDALKNCGKDFLIKTSANCGSSPECESKVLLSLTGSSYSTFGVGSLNIPSNLPNGNYILNVNYYCGETICKTCKFEIIKDCKLDTIPKNCCENSSWGKVYYQKEKAYVNLNLKGGHLGTFNCNTLLPITANYNCAPGCGPAQIKYIVLQNLVPVVPVQTLPSGSTFNLTIPTNTSTNYNLFILAICNGVECAIGDYTFNVECPSSSDSSCCGNKEFKSKGIWMADGWGPLPQCGATLGTYKCNVPKNFKFCYDCKQGCGPAKIKYEVINIATSLPEFSNIVSNCTSVSIPMNYANGSFQLKVSAICGDKVCATCRYNFKIECPANCCENSKWIKGPYIINEFSDEIHTINCEQQSVFYINKSRKNCDVPLMIMSSFSCNPNLTDCRAKEEYKLITLTGSPVYQSMGSHLVIPATLPDGTYYLIINGYCGDVICKTCSIKIIKDCDQGDCCKEGKWENKNYSISSPTIKTIPVNIECGKDYFVECIKDGKLTFNANYVCGNNCSEQVFVKVVDDDGNLITNTSAPFSMSIPSNPSTLLVTYYAKCGDKICDSCKFTVTNKKCPEKNCCDSSSWGKKTISWPGIKEKFENLEDGSSGSVDPKKSGSKLPITLGMKMLPPGGVTAYDPSGPLGLPPTSMQIECQTGYTLSQGGKYTFNATYNCADKTCLSTVQVKITGVNSSVYNGIFTCPYTKQFDVAGNYKIEYIAYCGNQECGRCEFQLLIEKNCCSGSKWLDAKYSIVNKKADGSWIWVPGVNNLPIPGTSGYTIPTLKADLGINISNLNYQCSDQKGCNVQYLVRRKNLTTGALYMADELLPAGQTTTSIYSQTFPQQVWIWGICGGQKCGLPVTFKVECLNKGCLPPCFSNDTLNFSTGMQINNTMIPYGTPDPYWTGVSREPYDIWGMPYPSWNNIPGAAVVVPPSGNIDEHGVTRMTRCFYVCKKTTVKFNGKFRCDNMVLDFQLKNSSGTVVWDLVTGGSFPTNNPQCWVDNLYSGNVTLEPGNYCFHFSYVNGWLDVKGGASLYGIMTTTAPVLANSPDDCCPTPPFNPSDVINGTGSINHNLDLSAFSENNSYCGGNWAPIQGTTPNEFTNTQFISINNNIIIGSTTGNWIVVDMTYQCSPSCPGGVPKYRIKWKGQTGFNDHWAKFIVFPNDEFDYQIWCCPDSLCKSGHFKVIEDNAPSLLSSKIKCPEYCTPSAGGIGCICLIRVVQDGFLNGTKQMLSKDEVSILLAPVLNAGSEIKVAKIVKTGENSYKLFATALNQKLQLIQTVEVNLVEEKDGFLSLTEKATITTQSMLPAQTKGASPGGGTCKKCGATFTNEQDFITHQENCEYTSVTVNIATKKHDYVGHVTLLR